MSAEKEKASELARSITSKIGQNLKDRAANYNNSNLNKNVIASNASAIDMKGKGNEDRVMSPDEGGVERSQMKSG